MSPLSYKHTGLVGALDKLQRLVFQLASITLNIAATVIGFVNPGVTSSSFTPGDRLWKLWLPLWAGCQHRASASTAQLCPSTVQIR